MDEECLKKEQEGKSKKWKNWVGKVKEKIWKGFSFLYLFCVCV